MDPWEVMTNMIAAQGTQFVFGLGDTYINMYAAGAGMKAVNVRHEASAPFMAMAYARLSGNIGVCTASPGPGVASLVPGVLEAYYGCSPIVMPCLSVTRKTAGMGEFQECDQVGMMRPITRWSAQVPRTDRIPWYMNRAFSEAVNGQPGPVYLDLPGDVAGFGPFTEHYGAERVTMEEPEYTPTRRFRPAADPEAVDRAVEMLLAAERPVVVAGNGAVLSGAFSEFREFIELLGIPFLTTPCGRGILSEDHPLALGLVGLYRTGVGREYFTDSDLLMTVGTRNEGFQTHGWSDYPPGARFIQLDIEPREIGRNWVPDLGLLGDARTVLRQLIGGLQVKSGPGFTRLPRVRELTAALEQQEAEVAEECSADTVPLLARRIVYDLNRVFGSEAILVNENGSQDTWSYCYPYYKVQSQLGCVSVAEQTCMGMGVVGAIAAKLTHPGRNVVCVTGDGAFQMYMQELATAAQYRAGCTWVILNNSSLGWIKWIQERHNAPDTTTTTFDVQPDFARFAEICGCVGMRVQQPSEIRPALQKALKANADGVPAVVDVIIDPEPDMSHFERADTDAPARGLVRSGGWST